MANFYRDNDDLRFYMERGLDWAPLVELTEYGFSDPDRVITVWLARDRARRRKMSARTRELPPSTKKGTGSLRSKVQMNSAVSGSMAISATRAGAAVPRRSLPMAWPSKA